MPRDFRLYLDDILQSIDKIQRYSSGISFDEFAKDDKSSDAVVRNLEIIGEAVKNIPLKIHKKYPEVEWIKMAGLRDILAHEYFGIDSAIVWDIIQNKLPPLKSYIIRIIDVEPQ